MAQDKRKKADKKATKAKAAKSSDKSKSAAGSAKSKAKAATKSGTGKRKKAGKPTATELARENKQLRQECEELKKRLDGIDKKSVRSVERRDDELELKPFQAELLKLQSHIEKTQQKIIILFEGRDAAGKGGTIRRTTRYMNEKHYRVVALGKPSDTQRTQWFYQRYVQQFPRGGEIVLFDRSWYNRAMVEPVFGFCTEYEYRNFLKGVVGFEKDLARHGIKMLKLYFSVTKEEQERRFDRRKTDPLRQWKLSEVDLQAQDRWDEFTKMKYEMLKKSHTPATPWTIIRSNDKQAARLNALKVICNTIDYEDRDMNLDFVPDPDIVVSGAREIERMEGDLMRHGRFTG